MAAHHPDRGLRGWDDRDFSRNFARWRAPGGKVAGARGEESVSDSPRSWTTQRFLEWIRSAGCRAHGKAGEARRPALLPRAEAARQSFGRESPALLGFDVAWRAGQSGPFVFGAKRGPRARSADCSCSCRLGRGRSMVSTELDDTEIPRVNPFRGLQSPRQSWGSPPWRASHGTPGRTVGSRPANPPQASSRRDRAKPAPAAGFPRGCRGLCSPRRGKKVRLVVANQSASSRGATSSTTSPRRSGPRERRRRLKPTASWAS